MQGTWNNIARLSKEDADWVVLGQPLAEAAKGHAGLQSTGSCRYHGADGGGMMVFDFIPQLVTADDCGYPDGTDRMFPQCGGGLQNH